jgi:phosphatidate phosphatase PAH1
MTTQKGKPFKDTSTEMSLEEIPEPFRNVLSEIIDKKINTEPLKRVTKVISKPLPQILDEMDENIRTAAEASSKAEEAARLAKQAAIDAHSASNKAEKQAEESLISGMKAAKKATQAAQKTVEQFKKTKQNIRKFEAMVLKRIESVEKKLLNIEGFLPSENIILLREISKKEAEKEIRKLFSEGQDLYYSDIAERLRLDLQLVVEICNELQNRGEIKVNDNTL